ncbi:MAG TPA: TIGR02206 family membrane protein [Thermoanaerobaculia bacterium]|nr:TIGR02206 family membrane protein [Thermoanaerobaculia bacterium]
MPPPSPPPPPPAAFKLFGASHFAVLGLTVAIPAALVWLVRRRGGERRVRPLARGLAAVLLVNDLGELAYSASLDPAHWREKLPLQLCDWVTFACVAALIWRRRTAFDLAYFWGLGGSLQAVLTPDLAEDFPRFHFFTFHIAHSGIIVAVLFLTLGLGMRPYPRSILRAFLWIQLYLVIMAGVNRLLGTNYGYLCYKPAHASLLDFLGPWPLYLASLQGLAVGLFFLLYAPYALADRLRARQESPAQAESQDSGG